MLAHARTQVTTRAWRRTCSSRIGGTGGGWPLCRPSNPVAISAGLFDRDDPDVAVGIVRSVAVSMSKARLVDDLRAFRARRGARRTERNDRAGKRAGRLQSASARPASPATPSSSASALAAGPTARSDACSSSYPGASAPIKTSAFARSGSERLAVQISTGRLWPACGGRSGVVVPRRGARRWRDHVDPC